MTDGNAAHGPDEGPPERPWRIGVDVGGTFTDLVLVDAAGRLRVVKAPSVPSSPADGVVNALERAALTFGVDVAGLLAGCALFVHGSTVATNVMLEGKGARVGLLATEGHRDTLEIRRGIRFHQWDHRAPNPPVLVPRHLRRPVRERIDARGAVLVPLGTDSVSAALDVFAEAGVDSVAVALLNAYADPAHERRVAEIVRRRGHRWVSVSTDILPVVGEYERTSTTVVDAALAPRVVTYLSALRDRLSGLGLTAPLLILQSNGGAVSVGQVSDRPVSLVLSGPAAGVGALSFIAPFAGSELIAMEIGGTSCDVTLMSGGRIAVTDELLIADYHVSVPSVEIHSVGAGGGTLAGVDAAGMLVVGPEGAGARPGPAAYGHGGTRPTVTDAQLVLGRLGPGPIGGGSVTLDAERAHAAVRTGVAEPLGIDVDAAAVGIVRLLEQKLLHAVERISVQRGHDPRRFALVAAGGAGPLHGASVGRLLGCRTVYVPRLSGAFCAMGMLHARLRQDDLRQLPGFVVGDPGTPGALTDAFVGLEDRARARLAREGFEGDRVAVERGLDLRYRGQQWSIGIPVGEDLSGPTVRAAFEAEYRRQFGHVQPDGIVEATAARVAGLGLLPPLRPVTRPPAEGPAVPVGERAVWLDERRGRRPTPVYAGADLRPGHRIAGPLVVAEATTTVFVGPDDVLEVDAADNFVLHLGAAGEARNAD
jgi:N-methylhydantoinase A